MKTETIPLEVAALVGQSNISLSAYFALQVGDILLLDQPIDKGLVVKVGEKASYLATAGLCETHKAIVIDERIHP